MPELTIQIGDSVNPLGIRDGDIIHAMNDVQLLWRHTQIVTDHRKIPGGFFKPLDSIAYRRLDAMSKWKVERLSDTEKRVTNLITLDTEIQVGHTKLYVKRRMAGGKKPMFGDEANAIWFEGQRELTLPLLSTLWTDHITPSTGLLEADHKQRDYNTPHLKRYLVIVTTDFSNARRAVLESPDMDEADPENPVMISRRKRMIPWRMLPGLSAEAIADIEDRHVKVAIRRDLIRNESLIAIERIS